MFGYVTAPIDQLPKAEQDRYRSVYCGLCRALGQRHGQAARFALTYDLTFLTLLLQSMYEPQERAGRGRCPVHPVKAHEWAVSSATDYAADMTIALTWYKCMDDWQDDHALHARAYAALLRPAFARVQAQWPVQCEAIAREMAEYDRLQAEGAHGGALCACFGRLMAALFAWRQDEWTNALCRIGFSLGQFICLMDGVMDYDRDRKKGTYNVLTAMEQTPDEAVPTLQVLAGEAAGVLERLPLVQDLGLLRSILYIGIWMKYSAAHPPEKQPNEQTISAAE